MNGFAAAAAAILPSIGVGLLFWYVMRQVVSADRRERAAIARQDAQEKARRESGDTPGGSV